jgi:hypothetical protein
MVMGDDRGQALLFSLGGEAYEPVMAKALESRFRFAGVVAVIDGRIEFEGVDGTALCMAHAIEAFTLAVAEVRGPVI